MDKTYNRVQWSKFVGKEEQWVLRGDSLDEVTDMREALLEELEKKGTPIGHVAPTHVLAPKTEQIHYKTPNTSEHLVSEERRCMIHQEPLGWGKGKNPPHKPYLYHKLPTGMFCFGK